MAVLMINFPTQTYELVQVDGFKNMFAFWKWNSFGLTGTAGENEQTSGVKDVQLKEHDQAVGNQRNHKELGD